jgi:hypothetical protein
MHGPYASGVSRCWCWGMHPCCLRIHNSLLQLQQGQVQVLPRRTRYNSNLQHHRISLSSSWQTASGSSTVPRKAAVSRLRHQEGAIVRAGLGSKSGPAQALLNQHTYLRLHRATVPRGESASCSSYILVYPDLWQTCDLQGQ